MKTRSLRARIDDMLDAIRGIEDTLKTIQPEAFETNWQARRAVERGLEIISEASRAIPDDLKQQTPQVPWPRIAAIGNILRHEYQRVEPLLVWNIAQDHLAALAKALEHIAAQLKD